LLQGFAPTWLLISAGYDAHRDDPITGLGLAAADYAALTERLVALAPRGRVITFLEGGYSLAGLRDSVAASVPVLAGGTATVPDGEGATSGGPGDRVVTAVAELWRQRRDG
jgi:acetoin utilization deacetylase AcuC-like enzyme